jgi:hypothetical protein
LVADFACPYWCTGADYWTSHPTQGNYREIEDPDFWKFVTDVGNRILASLPSGDRRFWRPFPRDLIPPFELSPDAREILASKPHAWGWRLLDQVIQDQLVVTSTLGNLDSNDIPTSTIPSTSDYLDFMSDKLSQIWEWSKRVEPLMNRDIRAAFEEPGNADAIAEVARIAALIHREFVIVQCELRSMTPPRELSDLHKLIIEWPSNYIMRSESFFSSLHHGVTLESLQAPAEKSPPRRTITWDIDDPPNLDEVRSEIQRQLTRMRARNTSGHLRPSGCLGAMVLALGLLALMTLMLRAI